MASVIREIGLPILGLIVGYLVARLQNKTEVAKVEAERDKIAVERDRLALERDRLMDERAKVAEERSDKDLERRISVYRDVLQAERNVSSVRFGGLVLDNPEVELAHFLGELRRHVDAAVMIAPNAVAAVMTNLVASHENYAAKGSIEAARATLVDLIRGDTGARP